MGGTRMLSHLGKLTLASVRGSSKARNDARYELVDRLARRLGYKLVNKHVAWLNDASFKAYMSAFAPNYRKVKDRHFVLRSLSASITHIPGDTAEAGVFEGASSFIIMRELGRSHFGFDSFEGLSKPDSRDTQTIAKLLVWKSGDLRSPESVAQAALKRFGDVTLLKGWIPDRFQEVADRRFCMVHIDVDLYQPTIDSLQFFYPRTNAGGMLVLDDYGLLTCPGARSASDDFMSDKPERIIHLTSGQGLIVKI